MADGLAAIVARDAETYAVMARLNNLRPDGSGWRDDFGEAVGDRRALLALLREAREALAAIQPTLDYALLQAEMTFDPLIRDGYAGGKREHQRMVKAGISGTPSLLTLRLREAVAAARDAFAALDPEPTAEVPEAESERELTDTERLQEFAARNGIPLPEGLHIDSNLYGPSRHKR